MASSQYARIASDDDRGPPTIPAISTPTHYNDLLPEVSDVEQLPSDSTAYQRPRTSSEGSIISDGCASSHSSHSSFDSQVAGPTTPVQVVDTAFMSGALPLDASSVGAQLHMGLSSNSLLPLPHQDDAKLGLLPRRLSSEERLKYSLSPQTHTSCDQFSYHSDKCRDNDDLDKTAKVFGSWQQAKRLWRLAALEWFTTLALCGVFAGVLAGYGRHEALLNPQVLQVNSLLTIITFLLGVNLAASMRSYAKLLRWRLLARDYQPLETFDLVLRCESLLNVCKLMWQIKKHKRRSYRWKTRAFCVIWLLANVALTLFVGMIGLTYSLDPQPKFYFYAKGDILIKDFSYLQKDSYNRGLMSVQNWGSRGFLHNCPWVHDNTTNTETCRSRKDGHAYYKLHAWNPTPKDFSVDGLSDVRIASDTKCEAAEVVKGANGLDQSITYRKGNTEVVDNIVDNEKDLPGPGGLLVASRTCRDCRGRSTDLRIFASSRDDGNNTSGWLFFCRNTLSEARQELNSSHGRVSLERAHDQYQFNDLIARMLAGALGWSGDPIRNYAGTKSIWQTKTYKSISEIGYAWDRTYETSPSVANVSDFVSTFTLKAMWAYDITRGRSDHYKRVEGVVPEQPQVLHIEWKWAGLLLGGIPLIQLLACIIVFLAANRAIIKDDSPIAMAKLYWSLLERYKLGEKGCIMRGDEIIDYIGEQSDQQHSGGPSVIYGWKYMGQKDSFGNNIGHVDVFEQDRGRTQPLSPTSMVFGGPDLMGHFRDGIRYNGRPAEQRIRKRRDGSSNIYKPL